MNRDTIDTYSRLLGVENPKKVEAFFRNFSQDRATWRDLANYKFKNNNSPLHSVVLRSDGADIIHLLTSMGADVNAINAYGVTPLQTAVGR
jgi:ankyrin repeat protein